MCECWCHTDISIEEFSRLLETVGHTEYCIPEEEAYGDDQDEVVIQ